MLTDLYFSKLKLQYLILPLIFFAFVSSNAYAIDYDLECPENKVVIVRTTNPDPICVFDTTAQKWVGMGIAEFVDVTSEEAVETLPEEIIDTIPAEIV